MTGADRVRRVELYGQLAGRLIQDRHGLVRFVAEPGSAPVGLRAPGASARAANPLPMWFEHLLPERDSVLRKRVARQAGLRQDQSFSILTELGGDLPGAVVVSRDDAGEESGPDPAAQESEPAAAATYRFSLAGMQPKLSVAQVADRFALPVRGEEGRWIAKLASPTYPELPEVEHATMRWAAAAGLDVPQTRVVPRAALELVAEPHESEPRPLLVVRRFDRVDGARVHQEDAAQAIGVAVDHKYGNSGPVHVSYDSLGAFVLDTMGEAAALEYVRRVAFVVVSGNNDAHLKNWSIQHLPDRSLRWSPLYDQVATVAWAPTEPTAGPDTLALKLGGDRRQTVTEDQVDRFCARTRIPSARRAFDEATACFVAVWPRLDLRPARMERGVERLWRLSPYLRRLAGAA